jgi:hypothetical protein
VTEEEWHRFLFACDPQIITVGELPHDLCKVIGAASPIIRMQHYYALKCQHKHGFGAYELMILPITIDLGRCICDRERSLTFFYFESVVFGQWFHTSIKANKLGTEIWVSTFHPSSHTEVARRCKKAGKIVRPEKE